MRDHTSASIRVSGSVSRVSGRLPQAAEPFLADGQMRLYRGAGGVGIAAGYGVEDDEVFGLAPGQVARLMRRVSRPRVRSLLGIARCPRWSNNATKAGLLAASAMDRWKAQAAFDDPEPRRVGGPLRQRACPLCLHGIVPG